LCSSDDYCTFFNVFNAAEYNDYNFNHYATRNYNNQYILEFEKKQESLLDLALNYADG
jgi:hypothetical protein